MYRGISGAPKDDVIGLATADKKKLRVSAWPINFQWLKWLNGVVEEVEKKPTRRGKVVLNGQVASLPTTVIPIPQVDAGLWRVTYRFRITTPGGVSSSLTFALSWTDGGVAQTFTGAAEAGNLTTTKQADTVPLRTDPNTPITFATTYASAGAPMAYSLDVVAEQVAMD